MKFDFYRNYSRLEPRKWLDCETIIVPDGIEKIGNYMFAECKKIKTVVIPNSVVEICDYAFFNCKSLKNVILPNNLEHIGDSAFAKTGLKTVIIPKSVKLIEKLAFAECPKLKMLVIPNIDCVIDSLVVIGSNAVKVLTEIDSLVLQTYNQDANQRDVEFISSNKYDHLTTSYNLYYHVNTII